MGGLVCSTRRHPPLAAALSSASSLPETQWLMPDAPRWSRKVHAGSSSIHFA
jgi:hypothetical protein